MKTYYFCVLVLTFLSLILAAESWAGNKLSLNPRRQQKSSTGHDCDKHVPAPVLNSKDWRKLAQEMAQLEYQEEKDTPLLDNKLALEVDFNFGINGFTRAARELRELEAPSSEDWLVSNDHHPDNVTKEDRKIRNNIKNMLDGDNSILVYDDAGLAVPVDANFDNFLLAVSEQTKGLSTEAKLMILGKIGDYLADGYDYDLPTKPTSMEDMFKNAQAGGVAGGVCRDIHQFINYVALAMGFEEVGLMTTNQYSEEDDNSVLHVFSYVRAKKGDDYALINYSKVINTRENKLPRAMEIADRWSGHSNDSVMVEVTKKNGKKQLEMFIPSSSRWVVSHLQHLTCHGDVTAEDKHRCKDQKLVKIDVDQNGSYTMSANVPFVTQDKKTKRGNVQSTFGIAGLAMSYQGRGEDRLTPEGTNDVFATGLIYGNSARTFDLGSKGSFLRFGGGGHAGYSYKKTSMLGSELQGFSADRHGVTLGLKFNSELNLKGPRLGNWQTYGRATYDFDMMVANQHVGSNLPAGDFTLPYWKREVSVEIGAEKQKEDRTHQFALRFDHQGHLQFKSGDLYDLTGGMKNKTIADQISAIYHFESGKTFAVTVEGTLMSLGGMRAQDALALRARLRLEAKDEEERINFYVIAETSAVFAGKSDNQWFASEDKFFNLFVGAGGKLQLRKENIEGAEKAGGSLYLTVQGGMEAGFAHPTLYLADNSGVDASGYNEGHKRSSNGTTPTMGQSGIALQGQIGIGGTFGMSAQERRRLRERRHARQRKLFQERVKETFQAEIEGDYLAAKKKVAKIKEELNGEISPEMSQMLEQIIIYESGSDSIEGN